MKWYFAGRVRHQEKLREIADFLKSKGEEFAADWIYESSFKPYDQNQEEVARVAVSAVKGIFEADIFVLISDSQGTDMFVELGVAIARENVSPESMRIYIVGEHSKRSLMQLHPAIVHVVNLSAVFEREGVGHEGFTVPKFE